jgi:hypothetical protein
MAKKNAKKEFKENWSSIGTILNCECDCGSLWIFGCPKSLHTKDSSLYGVRHGNGVCVLLNCISRKHRLVQFCAYNNIHIFPSYFLFLLSFHFLHFFHPLPPDAIEFISPPSNFFEFNVYLFMAWGRSLQFWRDKLRGERLQKNSIFGMSAAKFGTGIGLNRIQHWSPKMVPCHLLPLPFPFWILWIPFDGNIPSSLPPPSLCGILGGVAHGTRTFLPYKNATKSLKKF